MTAGLPRDRISTLAHDLNNLLTAILGAADTMLAAPALDPAIAEEAMHIRLAAERAGALARLMVARDSAEPSPAPSQVPLDATIDRLVPLLRRTLDAGIALQVIAGAADMLVPMDASGLDRVMLNLAANARHAMPSGGTLSVHTGLVGDTAWITVSDTGAGIAPSVLPSIFTPRFTTRDGDGAGLGLASVDRIVRDAGGAIVVDSVPGRGTMFRLILPCQAAAPPLAAEPVAVPRSPVVLLVEDEESVCRATTKGLRRNGWTVVHAGSAEAALAAVRDRSMPDVVVADAGLPGMDGLALIAALRALVPLLPAILVSGYTESGWAESSLRRDPAYDGVVILAKPYELGALSAAIAGVVRK